MSISESGAGPPPPGELITAPAGLTPTSVFRINPHALGVVDRRGVPARIAGNRSVDLNLGFFLLRLFSFGKSNHQNTVLERRLGFINLNLFRQIHGSSE